MDAALVQVQLRRQPRQRLRIFIGQERQFTRVGAFRRRNERSVERRDEAATEVRHLREGMLPATAIGHPHLLTRVNREVRGLVPPRRMADHLAARTEWTEKESE